MKSVRFTALTGSICQPPWVKFPVCKVCNNNNNQEKYKLVLRFSHKLKLDFLSLDNLRLKHKCHLAGETHT